MKEKAFVIFTDLDGTFMPLDMKTMKKFVKLAKNIEKKENVKTIFCPVSGRPGEYVVGVANTIKAFFGKNMEHMFKYAVGEQGAILRDVRNGSKQEYLGLDKGGVPVRKAIEEIINKKNYTVRKGKFKDKKIPFSQIFQDEPGKIFTSSIHIKEKLPSYMEEVNSKEIYQALRDAIIKSPIGDKIDITMASDCLEVMSKKVSKAIAVKAVLERIQKKYDVKGISYAGDGENDKTAINYFTKLGEILGVKANVYTPSNSQKAISTETLETKKVTENPHLKRRIKKGSKKFFAGVLELMKKDLLAGNLVSKYKPLGKIADDTILYKIRKEQNKRIINEEKNILVSDERAIKLLKYRLSKNANNKSRGIII
jgi:HAD superfamily hydrolase (TIGR01484 family)